MSVISDLSAQKAEAIPSYLIGKKEGKIMDFKILLNLDTSDDKKEFLCDVSSFANCEGGTLIYGAKEVAGACEEVEGIVVDNPDKMKQQIENLLRDSIEPNIPQLEVEIYQLSNGNGLLVIEMQQSFSKPHVVNYKGLWRVFSRNSVGKYPLDIYDLKTMINSGSEMLNGLFKYRNQRISSVLSEELNIRFENPSGPKLFVHIFPQNAFYKDQVIDLNEVRKLSGLIYPVCSDSCSQRLNFDGLLSYSTGSQNTITKYLQVFRNGVIETVNGDISHLSWSKHTGVWIDIICQGINQVVGQTIELYEKMQITAPIYIMISLLGLSDQYVFLDERKFRHDILRKFDRNNLMLPEILISDYNCNHTNELKPAFDMIWNSAGFDKCFIY